MKELYYCFVNSMKELYYCLVNSMKELYYCFVNSMKEIHYIPDLAPHNYYSDYKDHWLTEETQSLILCHTSPGPRAQDPSTSPWPAPCLSTGGGASDCRRQGVGAQCCSGRGGGRGGCGECELGVDWGRTGLLENTLLWKYSTVKIIYCESIPQWKFSKVKILYSVNN